MSQKKTGGYRPPQRRGYSPVARKKNVSNNEVPPSPPQGGSSTTSPSKLPARDSIKETGRKGDTERIAVSQGMESIEVSEIAKVLSGLRARRYYATSSKNDPVIESLEELASELSVPLNPYELDTSLLEGLRAAENNGADILDLNGHSVWEEMLLNEVPQNE